jgi:hypothetical protein
LNPTYLVSDAPSSDVQLLQGLGRLPERPSNASYPWTFCIEDPTGHVYRIILARESQLRSLRELLYALGYELAGRTEGFKEVYKLG